MIYINLLLIAFICVFIIDFSGVIENIDRMLQKALKNPLLHLPKPFSCSLCASWWLGIIYLICVGGFTLLNIAYVAFLAALTPVILRSLYLVRDLLDKALYGLEKLFHLN